MLSIKSLKSLYQRLSAIEGPATSIITWGAAFDSMTFNFEDPCIPFGAMRDKSTDVGYFLYLIKKLGKDLKEKAHLCTQPSAENPIGPELINLNMQMLDLIQTGLAIKDHLRAHENGVLTQILTEYSQLLLDRETELLQEQHHVQKQIALAHSAENRKQQMIARTQQLFDTEKQFQTALDVGKERDKHYQQFLGRVQVLEESSDPKDIHFPRKVSSILSDSAKLLTNMPKPIQLTTMPSELPEQPAPSQPQHQVINNTGLFSLDELYAISAQLIRAKALPTNIISWSTLYSEIRFRTNYEAIIKDYFEDVKKFREQLATFKKYTMEGLQISTPTPQELATLNKKLCRLIQAIPEIQKLVRQNEIDILQTAIDTYQFSKQQDKIYALQLSNQALHKVKIESTPSRESVQEVRAEHDHVEGRCQALKAQFFLYHKNEPKYAKAIKDLNTFLAYLSNCPAPNLVQERLKKFSENLLTIPIILPPFIFIKPAAAIKPAAPSAPGVTFNAS